uniref:S-layer homology domain-containing protein n=1 Tax=Tepidanaerobacter syntrophicus TaxID=224999 RepID=UPI001BD39543
ASLSDIYKDIAADSTSITADYKGHVTLALGLKLMSCENGKFSPGGSVTRAEAAAILVRMLRNQ